MALLKPPIAELNYFVAMVFHVSFISGTSPCFFKACRGAKHLNECLSAVMVDGRL